MFNTRDMKNDEGLSTRTNPKRHGPQATGALAGLALLVLGGCLQTTDPGLGEDPGFGDDDMGDDEPADGMTLVDGPAPLPLFVDLADGDVVYDGVAITLRDASLDGFEELAEDEVVQPQELTATVEVIGAGGIVYEVIVEDAPLRPEFGITIGWDTFGLEPTEENPWNEYRVRATFTDELDRSGSTEISVIIGLPPVTGPIVIEAIEWLADGAVFTLSIDAFDPDGDDELLSYLWYFQWSEMLVEGGALIDVEIPYETLEGEDPLVAETFIEDEDGISVETPGGLVIPDGPTPVDAETVDWCKCKTVTAKGGTADNTVPKGLPKTEPDRRKKLAKAQPMKLRMPFTVTLGVEGNSQKCDHWQRVRGGYSLQGATKKWTERKPAFPKPWHTTDPASSPGRVCGKADTYCLDGYCYAYDTTNTKHSPGKIVFEDAPGFNGLNFGHFYDDKGKASGLSIDFQFQGVCKGTDDKVVSANYGISAAVDVDGNPTGPKMTKGEDE